MNEETKKSFCPNCGTECKDGQKFCAKCGTLVERSQASQETSVNYTNPYPNPNYGQPRKKSNGLFYAIISILAVLIIGVTAVLAYIILNPGDDGNEVVTYESTETQQDNVSPLIDGYISNNYAADNVSVAVYDNKTGAYYDSDNSNQRYVAWGLYLPIYLAYENYYYNDTQTLANILSSNVSVCNNSANSAIRNLGGLNAVNSYLSSNFGASATNYGRLFGEVNSAYDNYTSAKEAVEFLRRFNETDNYSKLSYNIGSFGITAPSGATVYAHVGTENNNVRKEMNIFAIVKGQTSDYCVAILTRNSSSYHINGLLNVIHSAME